MEVHMFRCIDLIGIVGFAILVFSMGLLFPNSPETTSWNHSLEGFALWLVGFAVTVGWLILRWSVRFKGGPPSLLVWSIRQSNSKEIAAHAREKVRTKAA
jgi:hypothetical protein